MFESGQRLGQVLVDQNYVAVGEPAVTAGRFEVSFTITPEMCFINGRCVATVPGDEYDVAAIISEQPGTSRSLIESFEIVEGTR